MKGLVSSDRFHISSSLSKSIGRELLSQPNLKVIQFSGFKPDSLTLETLNDVIFKKRKDLTLRVYGYQDLWADISFLNHLPELERFDWDSDIFESIDPLYKVKKLTHLGLGFHKNKHNINLNFLSDFQNTLESLNLLGDYKNTIKTIENLPNLKSVWFSSTKLANFGFIENLPIETFGNYGSRVNNFEHLRNLKSLKNLWIKTNTKLDNIDFIDKLENLEKIELSYISKITKLPKLNHLKKLRKFIAFQCNRLEDFEEAKKLKDCAVHISGNKVENNLYKSENFIW